MGCAGIPVLTVLHTIYLDIVNLLVIRDHVLEIHDELACKVFEKMDTLKWKASSAFKDL